MNDHIRLAATAVGNFVDWLLDVDVTEKSLDAREHCLMLVDAVRLEESLIRGESIGSAANTARKVTVLKTALRRLASSTRAVFNDKQHECHEFAITMANAAESLAEGL